jgi:hypothetical protein
MSMALVIRGARGRLVTSLYKLDLVDFIYMEDLAVIFCLSPNLFRSSIKRFFLMPKDFLMHCLVDKGVFWLAKTGV